MTRTQESEYTRAVCMAAREQAEIFDLYELLQDQGKISDTEAMKAYYKKADEAAGVVREVAKRFGVDAQVVGDDIFFALDMQGRWS